MPLTEIVMSENVKLGWDKGQPVLERAKQGDPEAHKFITFGMRYANGRFEDKDPRIFSRDPEVIKEYYRDLGL